MYLIWGSFILAFFCIIQFIYLPVWNKRNDLKNLLKVETDSLKQIRTLQKEYTAATNLNTNWRLILDKRDKAFTLFSFLSMQVQKSGVKDNVVSMQPSTKEIDNSAYLISRVTIKITKTYLKELVDFLTRIETSEMGIKISSLSITKTGEKNEMLDAVIETETLILKEAA